MDCRSSQTLVVVFITTFALISFNISGSSIIDRHENFVNKGKGGGIIRESLFTEVAKSVCLM